jgi:hypothetical protein
MVMPVYTSIILTETVSKQMIYMSLPVLVPAALGVVLIRASLASHSSRRRIRLLEKDASHSSNLANIVAELENEMDEQVVELEHDEVTVESSTGENNDHSKFCNCKRKRGSAENSNSNASLSSSSSLHTSASENGSDKLVIRLRHGWRKSSSSADHSVSRSCSPAPSSPHESHADSAADESTTESSFSKSSRGRRKNRKSSGASSHPAPVLSNLQKDMIVSLNMLPNLWKERTYYDTIKNAHAAIVCRDDGLFTERRISAGDGALRHWADNFVF